MGLWISSHRWHDQGEWVWCQDHWFWVMVQAYRGDKFVCFTLFLNLRELFTSLQSDLYWKIKIEYCQSVTHFPWSCHICWLPQQDSWDYFWFAPSAMTSKPQLVVICLNIWWWFNLCVMQLSQYGVDYQVFFFSFFFWNYMVYCKKHTSYSYII